MKLKKLKINKSISTPHGKKLKGSIVSVACDSRNIPLNSFWRARLKDSAIDGCVEFVEDKPLITKKKNK